MIEILMFECFFFETRLKEEATLKLPILKSPPDNTPTKPYTDPEP